MNLSLQEEIRELRELIAQAAKQPLQEPMEPELHMKPIRDTGGGCQPSTSGSAGVDENTTSPPEAKGHKEIKR